MKGRNSANEATKAMRPSVKTSPVTVVLITLGLILIGLSVFGYKRGRDNRQYLLSAVTHQIDTHSATIRALLAEDQGSSTAEIEDSIYEELQRAPSTSLITRGMVSVHRSSQGVLECVIDTAPLGLQPRRIQEGRVSLSKA